MNLDQTAIELEQIALGALIISPEAVASWGLKRGDFSDVLHADFFEALQQAYQAGKPLSASGLARKFADVTIGEQTAREYIGGIVTHATTQITPATPSEIRDVVLRRGLAAIGVELKQIAADVHERPADALLDARNALMDLLARSGRKKTSVTIGEAGATLVERLTAGNTKSAVAIGRKTLDTALGGLHRGQFMIIAGRPGMGKSLVASSIGLSVARNRFGVLMFSLEMTSEEIASRCLSDLTSIPYRLATDGGLKANQLAEWGTAVARYENLPFLVDDQRALTISDITARATAQREEWERNGGALDVVIVDHIGLVRPSDRYRGNKVQEVAEISDGLATLAKELDVAVIALSQLNRGTEGRDNKRPTLADLRDSGSLEQDAHVVAFCYRQAYYLERMKCDPGTQQEDERRALLDGCRNTIEILIAKNRNGPTDSLTMFCDTACNALRDLQPSRPSHDISSRITGEGE